MYVCSKQNEEGTENPYSHMSHVSGGTPYSNKPLSRIFQNIFGTYGQKCANNLKY
jgi:hypothetical protein